MIKDRIKSTKEKLSNPQNDYGKWYKITDYILFFFVFSFIGWIWEVCLVLVQTGKLVNREYYLDHGFQYMVVEAYLFYYYLEKYLKTSYHFLFNDSSLYNY